MRRVSRVGLGVVDQGLSSISNVLFLVVVARAADVSTFGGVSFAYAVFAFGLAVQRVALGTLVSLSADKGSPPPIALAMVWASFIAAATVMLGASVGDGGTTAYYVVALAPVVVYPQDLLRYSAIAERQASVAAVSDGLWVVVILLLLGLDLLGRALPVVVIASVWLVAGAGGALVVLAWKLRGRLRWRTRWFAEHRDELRTLGPDAVLACLAPLVLALVLARYLTIEDVAAVRGAGTLLGPAAMLFAALPVVLMPEMARIAGRGRIKLAAVQASAMVVIVGTLGAALALVPTGLGEQILGDTWAASRAVLGWTVLEQVVWAAASGPISLLGAGRHWQQLLTVRVAYLGTVGVALACTAWTGNLNMVLAGMVVAAVSNCVIITLVAHRSVISLAGRSDASA